MKSILVIDTPENCDKCRLMRSHFDHGYGWIKECIGSGINDCIVFERKLEDYCPLKPIPKYYPSTSNPQRIEYLKQLGMTEKEQHYYELGHDDCIDEILGEQE